MPEDVPVFLLRLGRVDALLPAADFYGAAAGPECALRLDPGRGIPFLSVKGRELACVRLEPHFRALVEDCEEPDGAGAEAAAFLSRRAGREERAYLAERPFEMKTFPLASFRLPPSGVRRHLSRLGVAALRFSEGGTMQYVLNAHRLAPLPEQERSSRP